MRMFVLLLTLACAGCINSSSLEQLKTSPASHASLINASLPPLIPVETFFSSANESWEHRISPDGSKLLWLALHDGKPSIHFREIDSKKIHVIKAQRPVSWAYWAFDSRHITAWWDNKGDENYHFLIADTANPDIPVKDVTPREGVKVRFRQYFPDRPLEYLLQDNRRDPSVFDLYWLNIKTGEERLVMENPGDIMTFRTDKAGNVIAVTRRIDDQNWSFEVPDGQGWRSVIIGDAEDEFWLENHPDVGADWAWAISNIGRDKQVVVKVDLNTGEQTLFYEDEATDITGLWVDKITNKPLAAWSTPDYPNLKVFDDKLVPVVEQILQSGNARINFESWTMDKSIFTINVNRDRSGNQMFFLDVNSGELTPLESPLISAHSDNLSAVTPVQFKARDGLTLNGYLTIPNGTEGKNLPMVLAVHGGPFWRDSWGYSATDQFLANRGYAVLRVNYRGSTGYGREFMQAAKKQFARKMHDDLIDGVNWAIDKGIADPDKIAIFGRSYGGYATLVGLTFTPDVFAAGVNIVGLADLVTAFETFPAYWKNWLARWHLYVGDINNPQDREDMYNRSPINFVDRITKPLLVVQGANDVRVVREHSDRIVAAVKEKGLDVEYIVFDDEGHAIRNSKNRITLARAIEAFLGRHLGGRAQVSE